MSGESHETRRSGDGTPGARHVYKRVVFLALLLAVAWLLWSGFFKPLLLGLGVVSCLLTLLLVKRMGYFDVNSAVFGYNLRLVGYIAWLAGEVAKSSLEVARAVLKPRIDVHPKVIEIDARDLALVDQVLFGNSITLTPGSLTMQLHDDRLRVHTLTPEGAAALEAGEMQRRVAALRSR